MYKVDREEKSLYIYDVSRCVCAFISSRSPLISWQIFYTLSLSLEEIIAHIDHILEISNGNFNFLELQVCVYAR